VSCAGLILAAGVAARMGQPKPLMRVGSVSMIGSVLSAARDAELDEVVVVTGFHEAVVAKEVGRSARVVHNADASLGNMSSLVVGMDAVPDADCIVVLLADMPLVSPEAINRLHVEMHTSGRSAGWVEYADGRGHPVALGASTYSAVRRLHGRKALWPFLDALSADVVVRVVVDGPKPIDVNTADDYERLMRQVEGSDELPD
jgi:molybdenum cofactor cytidylyltransferase